MELVMVQQQRQVLSQKMIQSSNILQMSTQELYHYLLEISLENPVIDVIEPVSLIGDSSHESASFQRSIAEYQWLNSSDDSNHYRYNHQEENSSREALINWQTSHQNQNSSLSDALWEQLAAIPFHRKDAATLKYILESLDSWGYLTEPLEQIAAKMEQPLERTERLLFIIQSLDPPGIGARTLQECLLLQLKRQHHNSGALDFIITNCLDLLAKNQIPAIAKKAKISQKEAASYCQTIRALNPKPGAVFSDKDNIQYIHPDILVIKNKNENSYSIQLSDFMNPQIEINHYYRQLSKSSLETETQKYLVNKIQQAEWIRTCITQRNETLLHTVTAMVKIQKDFFEHGSVGLKPLRLSDIACSLGIHESTVSRAIRGKYLQCNRGVFPLHYFFSAKLSASSPQKQSSGHFSAEAAKSVLCQIIQEEDASSPLSDRALAERLSSTGISISRRTVAKYRDQLGLPDAAGRKKYE